MSTLSNALSSSITALKASQESIAVASNNIANADTPGYVKQRTNQSAVVVAGVGQGVEISSITADVDKQLLKSIQSQTSDLGYANSVNTILDDAQRLLGSPGENNSLSSKLDEFFSAFQILSNNPETSSLKLAAVNAAEELTSKISETAKGLYELQFQADNRINEDVSQVNNIIEELHQGNIEISSFGEGTGGRLEVEQKRDLSLRRLSEFVNINTNVDSNGTLTILTADGKSLLESSGPYKVDFRPSASVDSFIEGTATTLITTSAIQSDGSLGRAEIIANTGQDGKLETSLLSGSIKGFLEVRDNQLPNIIEQLDNLAFQVAEQVNNLSNSGSAFPPPSSLTGSTLVKESDVFGFEGEVRIAVLNKDGSPPNSPYETEQFYKPLTLDLSSLNSGNGAGKPDLQTVIDEINQYYGPPQNRASVGNLQDISLVSASSSISDGGTAQFNLELDNISIQDSTVVINSVTVIDPIDLSEDYNAATLPSPNSFTVDAGTRDQTDIPFTVDFSGGDNRAEYTVRVQVQVTDIDGNVSVADIDYNVKDDQQSILNDRFTAENVTNVSGESEFYTAPSSQRFLTASIVDENGEKILDGSEGFLNLEVNPAFDYGIAIDQLDSKEVGLPFSQASEITNQGFSQFFGLNDLLIQNDTVAGSAINLDVREDIKNNPSNLQTGKLILSNQPVDDNEALYTYELGSGSNKTVSAIAGLNDSLVNFEAAGSLAQINTTLSSYSADIIGFTATISTRASSLQETESLGLDGLNSLFQESAGVDTDSELARIIELENNYRASARVISVIQELFRLLTQTV